MKVAGTGAVILAAGGSTRLGRPKQLVVYQGQTLVERAARAVAEGGCSPIVMVTGDEHAQIEPHVSGLEVRLARHERWRLGIGSSIRAGIAQALAICPSLDALLLMVCDQPFADASLVRRLLAAREQTGKQIAASAYAGIVGVPVLFDRAFFPMLLALRDEEGAKTILRGRTSEIAPVTFEHGAVDIDTAEDCLTYLGIEAGSRERPPFAVHGSRD